MISMPWPVSSTRTTAASSQAHPGRAFAGRAQMLANWEAMFAGIPNFHAEIRRSVQDGDTTWSEWRWSGTRSDGQAL